MKIIKYKDFGLVIYTMLSKTKALEIQLSWNKFSDDMWFKFYYFKKTDGDHPCKSITIYYLKKGFFHLNVYDIRHREEIEKDKKYERRKKIIKNMNF